MRHIVRRLLQTPMFTVTTLVTLALGIGANSAIFSVIEGVLLKPLPFPEPDRLVAVWQTAPGINIKDLNASAGDYFTYREEGSTFEDVGLWNDCAAAVTGLAEPERVACLAVTHRTLPLLGIHPILGRSFTEKNEAPGSGDVVLLSYGYWQRRFGGDASVIGRRIVADGKAREVIGVLPQSFWFMDQKPDLVLPLEMERAKARLGGYNFQAIARLKSGATVAQANADVARMILIEQRKLPVPPGFSLEMFKEAKIGPSVRLLKQDVVGDVGKTLWVLMATIAMVLLIACANVANLLLVRAEGRQQELAIRAALGAGWGRIARELLLESLTLAAMGGALGLAMAYGALRLLVTLAPQLPRLDQISIDVPVLLFTAVASLLAGVFFGLIPVFKYAGPHLAMALRGGGRNSSQSRERHRARSGLVVIQVSLALVLLIGSGLMIRTFQAMRRVAPGFSSPDTLQTVRVSIPEVQVPEGERAVRMENDFLEKLSSIPGVSSVGLTTTLPMTGQSSQDPVFAEDHSYQEGQLPPLRRFLAVGPGYFRALGTPFVAGRDMTWTDVYSIRRVVLISESFAREYWGNAAASVGKRIRLTPKDPWFEIIGVVGDIRQDGVDQKAPSFVYWPLLAQSPDGKARAASYSIIVALRSSRAGSESFLSEIRQAVWAVNPNLPLAQVRTLGAIYQKSMARTSFTLVMLALAGGMALLLGVVGIYAVISYAVSQRTREIGIRMALGAQQSDLKIMFVRHGLLLVGIGVIAGLAAAAMVSRLMSTLLFEISPLDPVTYGSVSVLLVLAAMLASYLPARRVTSVDPAEALRSD
jgi:putative ABC transport system permease protein